MMRTEAWHGAVDGGSGKGLEASHRRYVADDPDGMATRRSAWPAMVGNRSATTNCTAGRHQDRRIAPSLVRTGLRRDPVPADDRRYRIRQPIRRDADRRLSEDVAEDRQAGDLPADITPHVLRHSFASLAADLGYNEPTIASLLGHKTHSITSRYVHSADAVLIAAADAVANATMKLMASDQAQPQLRKAARWIRDTRIRQISDICHQSRSPHEENGGTSALLASRNLGRDQITLPTRARHSSLQVRQCPYEFAGALLAGCLGEMRRYRQFWVLWRSREVNQRMLRRWRW